MPYSNIPKALWPKMEKCVADVKKQGKVTNAYAVCHDSVMGAPMKHGKRKATKEVNGEFILDPELAVLYKAGEVGYCEKCKKNKPGLKVGFKCPECGTKLTEMGKKELGYYDEVEQAVKEGLDFEEKSNPGHAGRPGKVGGSAPKGAAGASKKPGIQMRPGGGKLLGGQIGMAVGSVAGGLTGGPGGAVGGGILGGILGATIGHKIQSDSDRKRAKRIAKLAASKLKRAVSKSTKAAELTDDEAADKLLEALVQMLESYDPSAEAKKEYDEVEQAVKEGLGIKEVSYDAMSQAVRDAWYAKFKPNSGMEVKSDWYIQDVTPSRVVVKQDGKFMAYDYSGVGAGNINFIESYEVQLVPAQYIPVSKSV